jgi:transposase
MLTPDSLNDLSKKELVDKVRDLDFQVKELKRMIFGAMSERFISNEAASNQLNLGLTVEQVQPPTKQLKKIVSQTQKEDKPKPTGRNELPAHLERIIIEIEPNEDITGLQRIGTEITEELDYTPGRLFVRRYVRYKYARPDDTDGNTTVLIGSLPSRPIDKAIPAPGLLSQIMTDKFVDHLPIYRQINRYERLGVKLSSSTIGNWMAESYNLLYPLYDTLVKAVLNTDYLQVDETPLPVLDEGTKGHTHRGYIWVYHSPGQRLVLFDYRSGRGKEGPRILLKDYKGYLQVDGYEVYKDQQIGGQPGVILMHCMAHARRYFEKSIDSDRPRAEYFLKEVQQLYGIEQMCRDEKLDEQQIVAARINAIAILERVHQWLKANLTQVLPKSPIGKAIAYSLARWEKLGIYTTDGRLMIDNNEIENAIRPVALGRKNFLFAGSNNGAMRIALMYSLMASCKKHNINPTEYLKDILSRMQDYPVSQLRELLPDRWTPDVNNFYAQQ